MAPQRPRLSIVAPAFNEEEALPFFHAELVAFLADVEGEYDTEIIYVDDGSRDGTLNIIRSLAEADGRVRFVSFSRNFGHQAAFTAGLERATGDIVVLLDSDLQHPPAAIADFLAKWRQGADVVVGRRRAAGDRGRARQWLARGFSWLFQRLSGLKRQVSNSDFCLLSRRAVDALRQLPESHRFLRGLVQWIGFRVDVVDYRSAPRKAGKTKFSPLRLLSFGLDAVVSFSRAPLRLAFAAGLFFLCAAVGAGVLSVQQALTGEQIPAWGALIVSSVFLVGGCLLVCLGILGEYVGRVFEQVKARPLYLVQETEADVRAQRDANARAA